MENEINIKIDNLLKKIYTDRDISSYSKAVESTFNLFEDKNSWIHKFIKRLKAIKYKPVISGPGMSPFFYFGFNLAKIKTESFTKTTNLIFYVSVLDNFCTYFFVDQWIFHEYKTHTAEEYLSIKDTIKPPFDLKFRPPTFEIIYSERSLTKPIDLKTSQLLSIFNQEFIHYFFIHHQYLFLNTYNNMIPYYNGELKKTGDTTTLFELLFNDSHSRTTKTILN